MAAVIHNLLKTLFYREYTVYTSRLQTAESSFLLNVWLELGVINSCLTLPPGGQRAVLYIFFFLWLDYAWAQPVIMQCSTKQCFLVCNVEVYFFIVLSENK